MHGCACREEAAGIIAAQHKRKESGALAAYEEQLNDVRNFTRLPFKCSSSYLQNYKLELKKRREKLLGADSSHRSRSKDKKKKSKVRLGSGGVGYWGLCCSDKMDIHKSIAGKKQ